MVVGTLKPRGIMTEKTLRLIFGKKQKQPWAKWVSKCKKSWNRFVDILHVN